MTKSVTETMKAEPYVSVSDTGAVRGSFCLVGVVLLGFGLLYSLLGVGLGQVLFADKAKGSLILREGTVVGSKLVAQAFIGKAYFHPRPSAIDYDTWSLAGSNEARTDSNMRKRLEKTRSSIAQQESVDPADVPGELFTQSGSGVDPHISPKGALIQINRVAQSRGLDRIAVQTLVERYTEGKQFGWLGQPRVNVLQLNLALDALKPLAID